jgi:flagellar biosynthesis regulator FlaF
MIPDQTPAPQGAAAAAYRRRLTPKQMEAEVFARATRAIQAAPTGGPLARARAVADNRRLWDTVHASVLDRANALPAELRARIAGVALAVIRECDAEEPDLGFVAEMNDQFAAALWR